MDQATIAQQLDVVLRAPVVTLIGTGALIALIWVIFNWAYMLRIDALKERLNLANDRLAASSEELDRMRTQLKEWEDLRKPEQVQNSLDEKNLAAWARLLNERLANVIDANKATMHVSEPKIGYFPRVKQPTDQVHPGTAASFSSPTEPVKPTDQRP